MNGYFYLFSKTLSSNQNVKKHAESVQLHWQSLSAHQKNCLNIVSEREWLFDPCRTELNMETNSNVNVGNLLSKINENQCGLDKSAATNAHVCEILHNNKKRKRKDVDVKTHVKTEKVVRPKTAASSYRGVVRVIGADGNPDVWRATVRDDKGRVSTVGEFAQEEQAAHAYDQASLLVGKRKETPDVVTNFDLSSGDRVVRAKHKHRSGRANIKQEPA